MALVNKIKAGGWLYVFPLLLVVIMVIALYKTVTEPQPAIPIWTVSAMFVGSVFFFGIVGLVVDPKGTTVSLIEIRMRRTDLPFIAVLVAPFVLDLIFHSELTPGQSYAVTFVHLVILYLAEIYAFRMRETTKERRKGYDRRKTNDRRKR